MNIALGNDHGVVCRIGRGERKLLSEALDMPQKHLVSDTHNADAIVVRLNTFPHQNERAFNDVIPRHAVAFNLHEETFSGRYFVCGNGYVLGYIFIRKHRQTGVNKPNQGNTDCGRMRH